MGTFSQIRSTVLTGAIAFLPIFAIIFVILQSLKALGGIIRPLLGPLEADTGRDAVLVTSLSVLTLFAFLFTLGVLARHGPISRWLNGLNDKMAARVPGYSLLRGLVTSAVDEVETTRGFDPIAVRTGDGLRVGFAVDELPDQRLVVYVPNSPSPQSGFNLIMKRSDCIPIDMPAHKVLEGIKSYGRGLGRGFKDHE